MNVLFGWECVVCVLSAISKMNINFYVVKFSVIPSQQCLLYAVTYAYRIKRAKYKKKEEEAAVVVKVIEKTATNHIHFMLLVCGRLSTIYSLCV